MKNASDEFKSLAENEYGARYYHKLLVNGTEIEDNIDEFKYNGMCNDDESFGIGNACSAMVSFSIIDPSVNIENKEIEVYEGIEVDGTIEYLKLGIFKALKPNNDRNKVTYKCTDRMTYLMNMPYSSKLKVPTTDIAVLKEICSQVNISLVNSNLKSHTISSVPEGYTRREMIAYMSALQGKNAIINSEGNLELIWYTQSDFIVNDDKIYYEGTSDVNDEIDYTLGYIECTVRSEDSSKETTIKSGTGTKGIKIVNPFMTQKILDEVFSVIGGFSFRPCSFDFLGDFRLEVGDIVTVSTNNQTYIVPIMQLEHSSDGGVVTTITSVAETNTENEIDLSGPTTKAMDRYYAELVLINEAMINKLTVDEADARYISVDKIDAITLTVEKAVVEKLSADFADIHLANIDVADIGKFYADSGLLKDVTIVDGHITGELNAVRINADVIKSGTLAVDRLLVTGKNSIVYQINVNSSGLSLEELSDEKYQKYINGTDIVANSITANQIATKSITADQIDVESIFAQDITATGKITGLNLVSTTIDTPGFKVDENGKFDAISGVVGKFTIDNGILKCKAIDTNDNEIGVVMSNTNTLFGNVYTTTLGSNGIKIESTQHGATIKNNYVEFNDKQIELLGVLPTAGTQQYKAKIRTQLGNAADKRGLIIECEYGVQVKNGFLADVIETTSGANLDTLSTKVKNGSLRINNHFSGITKTVAAKTWSSTIGTITGTTAGEAILYAEGTFPGITGRKIVEIRKNGSRIARQESSYTGTGDTNAISVCTISTVAEGDEFTAHLYNGISAQKEITNCIFRMVQIGTINQ